MSRETKFLIVEKFLFLFTAKLMEVALKKRILEDDERNRELHEIAIKRAKTKSNDTLAELEKFVGQKLNHEQFRTLLHFCTSLQESRSKEVHLENNKTCTNFEVARAFCEGKPIVSAFETKTGDSFLDSFLDSFSDLTKIKEFQQDEFSVPISIEYRRGGYKFREIVQQEMANNFDVQEAIIVKLQNLGIMEKPLFPNWSSSLEVVTDWAAERAILEADCDLRDCGGEGSEEVEFEFWYMQLRKVQ
jgi:hypothetical protein